MVVGGSSRSLALSLYSSSWEGEKIVGMVVLWGYLVTVVDLNETWWPSVTRDGGWLPDIRGGDTSQLYPSRP